MNHTQGPWRVGDAGCTVFGPKRDDGRLPELIAKISSQPMALNQTRANAALVSCAPEMLEALKNVQRYLERSGEASLLESFGVNQAIEKACGGK